MGHIISKKKKKPSLHGVVTQAQVKAESPPQVKAEALPQVKAELPAQVKAEASRKDQVVTTTVDARFCTSIQLITLEDASKLTPTTPEEMWDIVRGTSSADALQLKPTSERKGWKTIRLFVSSTFKDFHQEREVLVREVFPDLRLWCEQRKLRLVECDLRWGVPKDTTSEDTIKICLSELDRCYEDNTAPYFLNLCGGRAGWVPSFEDLSSNVAMQYGWVHGLSVTEMEVVHGAFRNLNPNALFLIRDVTNAEDIPDDQKEDFFAGDEHMKEKLDTLKKVIKDTFPETHVKNYSVNCKVTDGKVKFDGLEGSDSNFSQVVYNFFLKQIEAMYPLDLSPQDPLQVQMEAHKMFLDSRSSSVLGRDRMLEQIEDYAVNGSTCGCALLVVGTAGAGKSAVIAKSAAKAGELAAQGNIATDNGHTRWRVFYHFVGATPRSTDLPSFLQRLTKEMKPDMHEVPSDLEALISLAYNLLQNTTTAPTIVFVDAINQMDADKQQYMSRWLPEQLSPTVRLIISTIEGTESHQALRSFKDSSGRASTEIICGPLDHDARQAIVGNILATYNKRLDPEQLAALLEKRGSENPLWLTLACEELRVCGVFETVTAMIHALPDDLIALEESVFERFEGETGGELMRACICMLEVSRHGLLETELLELLGDKRSIKCPEYKVGGDEIIESVTRASTQSLRDEHTVRENVSKMVQETYTKETESKEGETADKNSKQKDRKKGRRVAFLPARDWAIIYRNLKPLLRPCGDLGEGRLDFYHRSLSKAARRRYFSGDDDEKKHTYNFWHGVLADYFEGVLDMDRKAEELPYHLEQLLDNNRLIQCLMDWEVFHRLYNDDFSIDLLHSWQTAGGYGIASAVYKESLKALRNSDMPLIEYAEVLEKVYGFLIQAGQYEEVLVLLDQRLAIETDELGERGMRPTELADCYYKTALCKSEIDKAFQYLNPDQIDDNRHIVECGRKCLEYLEQERLATGNNDEYRGGQANILISHHLSNIADLLHGEDSEVRQESFDAIHAAQQVFEKINDQGKIAECLMTKAIIDFDQPFPVRQKFLDDALDLCIKAYGERHLLTTRIYLNTGIAYEMNEDFEKAFKLFISLRDTCLAVFGPAHPKSVRAVNTLKEPRYKLRLEQQERSVPDVA